MAIIYQCGHCGHVIGRLNQRVVQTSMLGLDQLSKKDQKHMIQYLENGDVQIRSICENCEDTLQQHPHYHELDHFLQ